ncbi:MAG: membrane protein insertase YidC [Alphaproteobacteria bacterium]|nr:membrane protein insertase YidC [Alphaproteobacteria bacterium]
MVKYLDNQNSGFNQWRAKQDAAKPRASFSRILWWTLVFMAAWWLIGVLMTPKTVRDVTNENVVVEDLSAVPTRAISSDMVSATVQGLRINDVKLSNFTVAPDSTDLVTLLGGDKDFIEVGYIATGTTAPVSTTVWKEQDGAYTWRNSDGVEFERKITTDGYVITVTDTIKNTGRANVTFAPYARIVRENDMKSSSGVNTGAIAYVNSDVEQETWTSLEKKSYAYSTTNGFAGFTDQYWETVVSLDSPDQTIRIKKSDDKYNADVAAAAVSIAPGASHTITTRAFVGPRDQDVLNAAEKSITGIAETVDYGWFWFLARPMLWVLNGINSVVMNYGLAIIIMTILLRLLMWPLTRKSYVSMAAMQKMQPELQRIQKLYANDKMRLQMEMMKLYQTHKTSPMSGCLPMLIQIPIFFALYKALLVSVQMRSAHFLWISDLAAMDPYFILPVLMGATMWLQQYLQSSNAKNTSGNDAMAQTQRMMRWMPLLFTVMFAWMPAGLVLYWTVSNIFGIIQMQMIKKKMK